MLTSRFIPALILGAALAVSGCVGTTDVSRNLGFDAQPVVEDFAVQDWSIAAFDVIVPETLTVSEANTLKPRADIVWRGEPIGDRRAQVDALMTAALEPAFEAVNGSIPAVVTIEVTRFHAQTQRVRYTNLPSEHEIEFVMTVRHAETGVILSGPTDIDLTFPALGGADAIAADARGETQALRIRARLMQWVQQEFVGPAPDGLISGTS
jgi:hypothetical protein